MALQTRREAARRLWELGRWCQREADKSYPAPVRIDAITQNEINFLCEALEMGAEALEPVGRVEEEDAFSEFTEGRPGYVMHRPRREGRR